MTKVNVEVLHSTAQSVRAQNALIKESFEIPKNSILVMDNSWSGRVSENAMRAFYKICQYTEPRSKVLENIAMAMDTIATGYTKTDEKNTSLADRFK